jgi:hypothetical protein
MEIMKRILDDPIKVGHLANLATIIYFTVLTVGGGAAVFEGVRRIVGKAS